MVQPGLKPRSVGLYANMFTVANTGERIENNFYLILFFYILQVLYIKWRKISNCIKEQQRNLWKVRAGGDHSGDSDAKRAPHPRRPLSWPGSQLAAPASAPALSLLPLLCSPMQDAMLREDKPGPGRREPDVDRTPCPPHPQVNPFRDRICRVFSHNNVFSFEDVLGMASVFSEQACPSLKIEYAFRIYGQCRGGLSDGAGSAAGSVPHLQSTNVTAWVGGGNWGLPQGVRTWSCFSRTCRFLKN